MERLKNCTGTAAFLGSDFNQAFGAHTQPATVQEFIHALVDLTFVVKDRLPQVGAIADLDDFGFTRFRILECYLRHVTFKLP